MKREKKAAKMHSIRRYAVIKAVVFGIVSAVIAGAFLGVLALSAYASVRRTLESQIKGSLEERYFSMRMDREETFADAARHFVNFFSVSGVEVWVLDHSRKVVASTHEEITLPREMPDYENAMAAPNRRGFGVGSYHGEPAYVFSYILDISNHENTAVRLLMPLREVNQQLIRAAVLTGIIWLVVNLLMILSESITLRHLRKPIARVGMAATKIAEGDYGHRIPLPRRRNELYQLSDDINNMAEKLAVAEKTKKDFFSTISHELRTPLTAIKGWGETLLQTKNLDGDLMHRGLGIIIAESGRLDRLVEELLDFSSMQGEPMALRRENIDVLAELDDVIFFNRERAAKEGVELVCVTPEEPAPMLGDPARIRQVFINLLDNAFKHTPQGGAVNVAAHFMPEQQQLHVTIKDTGCGVDEKELPYLTEKFYKSSAATKGSGIGLAVVDEILRAHGCALRLESAAGKGFKVHITFPLLKK